MENPAESLVTSGKNTRRGFQQSSKGVEGAGNGRSSHPFCMPRHSLTTAPSCPLPVDCPWQDKEPKPGQKCEQCWVRWSQPAAPEPTAAEVWGSQILEPVMAKNTWREGRGAALGEEPTWRQLLGTPHLGTSPHYPQQPQKAAGPEVSPNPLQLTGPTLRFSQEGFKQVYMEKGL